MVGINRQTFQKYQFAFGALAVFSFLLVNNTINAITQYLELYRVGDNTTALWEPFAWEYTSALSSLIIFPFIVWVIKLAPITRLSLSKGMVIYLGAAVIYSLSHVVIMVGLRELVYWVSGGDYEFGHWSFELLYEMQKDVWSFVFWIIIYHGYQFIISRWLGEATPIQQADCGEEPEPSPTSSIDRLIVKKLGKEFIIDVKDIQWMESAGNYVNLYVAGRIYPMRATLASLTTQLANHGLSRIHRSYAINVNHIVSITPLASGDSEVLLADNKVLKLSRRYKDAFRMQLALT
ncbi:LytTR family transcriptional regulator DNA-binding domain-containing protein [Thalassotalea fusca]